MEEENEVVQIVPDLDVLQVIAWILVQVSRVVTSPIVWFFSNALLLHEGWTICVFCLFDVSGLGFLTKEEKRGICFSFGPELHCREYSGQAIFFGQFFFYLFEVFFFQIYG
jgi:hypothetical protein